MLLRLPGHAIAMRLTMLAPCSSCASFLSYLNAQAPRSCLSWSQGKLCCGMRHTLHTTRSTTCLMSLILASDVEADAIEQPYSDVKLLLLRGWDPICESAPQSSRIYRKNWAVAKPGGSRRCSCFPRLP